MPQPSSGYQPRNTPAERRAFFDLKRQVDQLAAGDGGGGPPNWPDGYPTYDPRYINVTGDTMTGDLVLAADPNQPMEAATKQYVDAHVGTGVPNWPDGYPTYDPRYVNVGGDTMTGLLVVNTPSGNSIQLTSGSIGSSYAGFYDSVGRLGYMGAVGNWFRLQAEQSLPALMQSVSAHARVHAADYVDIYSGNTLTARFDASNNIIFNKTDPNAVNTFGQTFKSNGQYHNAITASGIVNQVLNRAGAANANGQMFVSFERADARIGSITTPTVSSVAYNTTSDWRLKNDLGPIADASSRLRQLRPVRVTWKSDPEQIEQDAFLAHEVAEVVPQAVTGEKDAVDEQGQIDPQQLDATRLIPLLTAALQDAHARIDALEARLATLGAA